MFPKERNPAVYP